jgi:HPt (histidine-containing phosphotransfer) domain-containing protein
MERHAMADELTKVRVERELEDLVPAFMENRRKDIDALKAAHTSAEFEKMRQIGHRMKGVGTSYGFTHVTTLGKRIEDAARAADAGALQALIAEYADYLARVQVSFG